jgi:hypothetical protein
MHKRQAGAYRNELIVALLAARPLRRRNFVALELSRHLLRAYAGWRLVIPGSETKTGAAARPPFPAVLAARLGAALWLSAELGL